MRFGIAVGPGNRPSSWTNYQHACERLQVDNVLIDIKSSNWLSSYQKLYNTIDGLLVGPPCMNPEEYDIYMERLYFIQKEFDTPIYPSYDELKLYENKRYCSHWLEQHGYSAPVTKVFCDKAEMVSFLKNCVYPIVVKAPIGAGASAVHIVKSKSKAIRIANHVFGIHRLLSFGYVSWVIDTKMRIPIPLVGSSLKHNIVIQEYVPIKWEWRIIKIGESYFGHQKLLKGNYASGSDKVGWVDPPKHLLDLIRDICDTGHFVSMAMDVFETIDGIYLINELQSMFGSYMDSQMFINGTPGRYVYDNGEYIFEKGFFNVYGSRLLRVRHFYEILTGNRLDISRLEDIYRV